jgi:hypothetical protein
MILKMADKRALVAATIIATGCSDIFTQDIEDMPEYQPEPPARKAPHQEKVNAPSIQSLMQKAKAMKLCTDGSSFCAWAAANVFGCEQFALGVKPTPEQCVNIADALSSV